MCGLAGFINTSGEVDNQRHVTTLVSRMSEKPACREPEGQDSVSSSNGDYTFLGVKGGEE